METVAYLDCPTGIAGDMCLGALVDLGLPLEYLQAQLAQLGLGQEYHLHSTPVLRQGQAGTQVQVHLAHHSHHHNHDHHHGHHHEHHPPARHLPEIRHLIENTALPPRVKRWSLEIFQNLAIAEGAVHNQPPETVHFHEVGATDALVDIMGTCIGLDWLGVDRLFCSPLPTGGGTVWAAHGRLPVPVPAVLALWQQRQVPVYTNGIEKELVTPTGAAIAVTLAETFGPAPAMRLRQVGKGAGNHDLPIPNLLRLWVGEREGGGDRQTVLTLETQIDDASPQLLAYVTEQLLALGVWDVFQQGITMKKGRLGTLLTVICDPTLGDRCEDLLFRETPTLGIRRSLQERTILPREWVTVATIYGAIRVKVSGQKAHPEYEDCARIARDQNLPLATVQRQAIEVWKKTIHCP